jgi:hypothetical protein
LAQFQTQQNHQGASLGSFSGRWAYQSSLSVFRLPRYLTLSASAPFEPMLRDALRELAHLRTQGQKLDTNQPGA